MKYDFCIHVWTVLFRSCFSLHGHNCFPWQTFHDRKHLDEDASYGKAEVDLSSPSELAEALQSRTFGTSRMVSLVNILQDLLAIELLEKNDK